MNSDFHCILQNWLGSADPGEKLQLRPCFGLHISIYVSFVWPYKYNFLDFLKSIATLQFEMAKTYLKPTIGGTVVDASCGSGLFSRLFVKSGLYSLVVALDFSENMLKQCNEYIKQENISDEYDFDHCLCFCNYLSCSIKM